MLSFLKDHPFAVEAFFERSLVLTYAVPSAQLAGRIPPCLTLDTFQDQWAFVAVAMVQTRRLRPAGFPAWLGSDFFLSGYRIFVRFPSASSRGRRGLYILRSETDRKKMELLGNLFTHYHYSTTDLELTAQNERTLIQSRKSGLLIEVLEGNENVPLPSASPFANWSEARRFAGPLPFTFSWKPSTQQVIIVEGVHEAWQPAPVQVLRAQVPFLDSLHCPGMVLANAFSLRDIPYRWKKGRQESWPP